MSYSKQQDLKKLANELEITYGFDIFAELVGGEHLLKNKKLIRLFDESKTTSEMFYSGGRNGKPSVFLP